MNLIHDEHDPEVTYPAQLVIKRPDAEGDLWFTVGVAVPRPDGSGFVVQLDQSVKCDLPAQRAGEAEKLPK